MKYTALILFVACICLPFSLRAATVTLTANVKLPSVCGNNIREDGEQCDGPDLGAASCSMLGYSSGSLSCTPSCTFNVSSCASSASNIFLNSFPVSGGTYRFTNSDATEVALTVAPNSATDTLQLFTFVYPSTAIASTSPAPGDTSFVGKIYNLIFVSSDGNIVHSLDNPVTIVLPYTDGDVDGLDPTTLKAYRQESGETLWHLVSNSVVDTVAHTVTFTTSSFSQFAIFGTPPAPVTPISSVLSSISSSISGSVQRAFSWILKPIAAIKSYIAARKIGDADINSDGVVDMKDFSVLAYWYGRPNPPDNVDLNSDKRVDLVDFSILIHSWSAAMPVNKVH